MIVLFSPKFVDFIVIIVPLSFSCLLFVFNFDLFLFFFFFVVVVVVCNKNNTTGVNSGAITTYPTGTTELNPGFNGVRVV